MFRDREEELRRLEEELRRLEEELLAQEEYEEEIDDEEYDEELDEAPAQTIHKQNCRVYNGDRQLDVDLAEFSEDVRVGRRRSWLPWVFIVLTAALLLLGYLYLKQGGYLP